MIINDKTNYCKSHTNVCAGQLGTSLWMEKKNKKTNIPDSLEMLATRNVQI